MKNLLKNDALVVRLNKVFDFLTAFLAVYSEKGVGDMQAPDAEKLYGLAHPLKKVLQRITDETMKNEIKAVAKNNPHRFFNKMREAARIIGSLRNSVRESLVDGLPVKNAKEFLPKLDMVRRVLKSETYAVKNNPNSMISEELLKQDLIEQKLDKNYACVDTNIERMLATLRLSEEMLMLDTLFAEED